MAAKTTSHVGIERPARKIVLDVLVFVREGEADDNQPSKKQQNDDPVDYAHKLGFSGWFQKKTEGEWSTILAAGCGRVDQRVDLHVGTSVLPAPLVIKARVCRMPSHKRPAG